MQTLHPNLVFSLTTFLSYRDITSLAGANKHLSRTIRSLWEVLLQKKYPEVELDHTKSCQQQYRELDECYFLYLKRQEISTSVLVTSRKEFFEGVLTCVTRRRGPSEAYIPGHIPYGNFQKSIEAWSYVEISIDRIELCISRRFGRDFLCGIVQAMNWEGYHVSIIVISYGPGYHISMTTVWVQESLDVLLPDSWSFPEDINLHITTLL